VTRREMVKFMTLGSLLLAGANWIAAIAGQLLHRGRKLSAISEPFQRWSERARSSFAIPRPGSLHCRPHAGWQVGRIFAGLYSPLLCCCVRQG